MYGSNREAQLGPVMRALFDELPPNHLAPSSSLDGAFFSGAPLCMGLRAPAPRSPDEGAGRREAPYCMACRGNRQLSARVCQRNPGFLPRTPSSRPLHPVSNEVASPRRSW
jgi:hypothetical protein